MPNDAIAKKTRFEVVRSISIPTKNQDPSSESPPIKFMPMLHLRKSLPTNKRQDLTPLQLMLKNDGQKKSKLKSGEQILLDILKGNQ